MPRPFRSPVAVGVIQVVDPAPVTWNQYAFAWDGTPDGNFYAYLYNDGDYASTRGDIAMTGSAQNPNLWTIIHEDSSATVGDGSLAYRGGSGVCVWDVEGGVLYETALSNTTRGGIVYKAGKLYWIEDDGAGNLLVKESDTDLTNISTLSTIVHGMSNFGGGSAGPIYNSSALFFEGTDNLGTTYRWRVAISGGATTSADITGEVSLMFAGGAPRSDGKPTFFSSDSLFEDYRLCVLDSDSASASVTEVWPSWSLVPQSTANGVVASMGTAGTSAQIYGVSVSGNGGAYRDATSGSFGGAPATSLVPEDSPDTQFLSGYNALFYAGE